MFMQNEFNGNAEVVPEWVQNNVEIERLVIRSACEALLRAKFNNQETEKRWWTEEMWPGDNRAFLGRLPEDVFKENPAIVYDYLMKISAEGK